ncbi:hypothetical protein GTCCBUS3UF5_8500 [Geobacillus thermoleovorans CCB_US3_UF5]|uniref:Uncharacterized protein n=1 Tax=Geobacillus thermoleovorans CCB_US3_UF5 TaxID=1111068 RepID=A0ABN4A4B5_GEOTH|nr:hypothetical protein GTCCBUS3UF5_8500 [Geobacillus thermoleovorans CCB_US3_UF5]GAJ59948.1 hypothetical protein B23_3174 [Geobacillus thermoleovorans B23]
MRNGADGVSFQTFRQAHLSGTCYSALSNENETFFPKWNMSCFGRKM